MLLTNQYLLPQSFYDVINSLVYDPTESDPKRIGVTTLINPPRQRLLTVRHWDELEEDISDSIWRILGEAAHYVMSKAENEHRLIEEKITHDIDGITIVAKPDSYDDKTKAIEDFKVTSIWSFKFGAKLEWEKQLNCYAWSLAKFGLEVKSIHINAILRDWSKGEMLRYRDYPKIPFQKIDINLWSFEEQEKFIKEKVKEYKIALNLDDDELPLCDEKARWKTEDVYAVYKNTNKTATKLCTSEEEAKQYILEIGETKDKYRIEKRPGIDKKCVDYCICNKVCGFFKENYGNLS
jgi:hypothetical protein